MHLVRSDSPLGPQCLRCRRRRVKCDSAPVTCQRCVRDGHECPGYEKQAKWKVVTPEAMRNSKRCKTTHPSAQTDNQPQSGSSTTGSSQSSSPGSRSTAVDLVMPASLVLSTIEKEIIEVQSAVIYYNESLVPDLAASPIPSETISIPLDTWLENSPKVLHHIIVTVVTCHQLARNGSPHGVPTANDDQQLADTLNRHRGRGLTQLQRILSDFWHGSGGQQVLTHDQRRAKGILTLVAVVMLLTQEVQMSATSLWSMHLEAARSLVHQLGGFEAFWSAHPLHQGVFALYLMIDVMSPPTSPAWSINEQQQRVYLSTIAKLPDLERRLIASFHPCPLPVLQAIVQTNLLRAVLHRKHERGAGYSLELNDVNRTDDAELPQVSALTLASLLRFDPSAWARKVCSEYLELSHPRPPHDADEESWTALATAYRCAAVIYLLRSTQCTLPTVRSGEEMESLLHEQRTALSGTLSKLCKDMRCNGDGAAGPALWRFLSWPLFVHAYELVAWSPLPSTSQSADVFDTTPSSDQKGLLSPPKSAVTALQRLERVARRMGANSLFEGAELLEGVWRRRCSREEELRPWGWDDGFEGRCVFTV